MFDNKVELMDIKAKLVIIGDGIAGLSLAYIAAQRGIRAAVLGKNLKGTTHSATGLIAPRPDYLLSDSELVRQTSVECLRFAKTFGPEVLKRRQFLIPTYSGFPVNTGNLNVLLSLYDEVARSRFDNFERHDFISSSVLEKMEPNLRKNRFGGAFSVAEWTVDPAVLLRKLDNEAVIFLGKTRRFDIGELDGFHIQNGVIREVRAVFADGNSVRISNNSEPLAVVNTAGPWMKDVCASLGLTMNYQLRTGLQIEFPGWYFQSGIIMFDKNGKYLICLQKNGSIQVGPTNSPFSGHPSQFSESIGDINSLVTPFLELLEDGKIPKISAMRHGFRVKSTYTDTNRPVIWRHATDGPMNFYSLHPGKMALALRAADEMLDVLASNGWIRKTVICAKSPIHLEGDKGLRNEAKLLWLKAVSLFKLAIYFIKFKIKTPW
ncbi:MAG TPA: FAD-dependent oxidoreductase [Candidatus Paceibacterota bacterium]|nr:FAD-dependent oxidoreductase [Candidatus Paceibacterota bacterium]